jgi:hypothetical protein
VHAAYQLDDVTGEQMEKVNDTLRQLELERGERIKKAKAEATDDGDTPKRTSRPKRPKPGVYLRDRTPLDAGEPAIEITAGDAPAELQ